MSLPDEVRAAQEQPSPGGFLVALGRAIAAVWRGWRAPVRHDFEREACDQADLVVRENIETARRRLVLRGGGGDDAA